MSALAFDTHKAVTALKQAGFEETQAEVVVSTMGEALGGNVATKADVTEVRIAQVMDGFLDKYLRFNEPACY